MHGSQQPVPRAFHTGSAWSPRRWQLLGPPGALAPGPSCQVTHGGRGRRASFLGVEGLREPGTVHCVAQASAERWEGRGVVILRGAMGGGSGGD